MTTPDRACGMGHEPQSCEVLVIGAGVIGCACAYYLASAGLQVIVVDRGEVGGGASGGCDGFVFLQSKRPGKHLELAIKSAQRYESLSVELGCDLELERVGGLVLFGSPEERRAVEAAIPRQREVGLDIQLLDGPEVRRRIPWLRDGVLGASFLASEAKVNPLLVTAAFARAAERCGASLRTWEEVQHIEVGRRAEHRVVTDHGTYRARWIVNAAGAWASRIGEMVGEELPIQPRRGQLLVTEPTPSVLRHILLSGSYLTAKLRAPAEPLGLGFAIEQTKSGSLLIGSTREFVGYDRRTTCEGITEITRQAVALLPPLHDVLIVRSFAALRPYTPDNLPIIRLSERVPRFVNACGHGGDGITLAPITGEMVAQMVREG